MLLPKVRAGHPGCDWRATLIDEVLSNGAYLESVRKLQKSIAQRNGLSAAANLVEEAFGLSGFTNSAPLLRGALF